MEWALGQWLHDVHSRKSPEGSFPSLCGGQGPGLSVLRGSSSFPNSPPAAASHVGKGPQDRLTERIPALLISEPSRRPATQGRRWGRGPSRPGALLMPQMWFVCAQKTHSVTSLVFKITFPLKSIASLSF